MTTSDASPTRRRASRARVVLVGNGVPVRELAMLMRRHLPAVSEFESLYDAISEVGLSPAREPVAAVIVSADVDGFDMRRVVDAFRRADPTVPLVLAVREGQEELVAEGIAEDFEHSLVLPAQPDELLRVLGEIGAIEQRPQSPTPAAPKPEQPAPSADRGVVEIAIEDAIAGASRARGALQPSAEPERARPVAPKPTGAGHDRQPPHRAEPQRTDTPWPEPQRAEAPKGDQRRSDAARHDARHDAQHDARHDAQHDARAQRRRSPGFSMPAPPPASPPRDGPPGDIDLVRAVLEHSDLQAAALRVLRHHLGTADVRFVAAARPGEEEAVAVDRRGLRQATVASEGHIYGVLLSTTLDEATLSAWAVWLSHWLRLEESHRELRRFAWTDELTGAGNRRAFETVLRDTMARAMADRRTISLMYLDIDDFKRYNDDCGHHAGDEVLRETAELLRTCVRAGDHVFRIGGDEFVVLFCDTSAPRAGGGTAPESVEAIARRFQRAISDLRLPQIGREGPATVTVSAGVAIFPWEGQDPDTLLRRADQRALESKRNGKNHITFGPGAPESRAP